MIMEINKGDRFVCKIGKIINGVTYFERNKVYVSESNGSIMGELRNEYQFTKEELKDLERFFERIPKVNVKQIRNEKENLGINILKLIKEFECKTETFVTGIEFKRNVDRIFNSDGRTELKVKVEI